MNEQEAYEKVNRLRKQEKDIRDICSLFYPEPLPFFVRRKKGLARLQTVDTDTNIPELIHCWDNDPMDKDILAMDHRLSVWTEEEWAEGERDESLPASMAVLEPLLKLFK